MTYKEKLQQANKEAKAAIIALILTVMVWIIAGFGVASFDIVVFNTPLWIITGCFGTWIFAVAAAIYMSVFVFKDIDLDDDPLTGSDVLSSVEDPSSRPEQLSSQEPFDSVNRQGVE